MPIGSVSPFRPTGTASVSASGTSASIPLIGGGDSVVVTNTSSSLAYVAFGSDPAITASIADMPILANSYLVLSINSLISYAAAITPSGSGAVLFSRGDGSLL